VLRGLDDQGRWLCDAARMRRLGWTAAALPLVAAAMWFAWLGWDHQYYLVDGVPQGPYRPWQVVGCALSIATAAVLACVRVRQSRAIFPLAFLAATGFAVPWSIDAAQQDGSGLWAVGLAMLLIGGGLGLTLLLAATDAFLNPKTTPTAALKVCCLVTVLTLLLAPWPTAAIVPLVATAVVFFGRWLPDRRKRAA
jgi:hypothetical protein